MRLCSVAFLAVTVATANACTAGYETFYGGRCMKIMTHGVEAIAKNFDNQHAHCEDEGTYMAMLKTQPDEQFIMDFSKHNFKDHSMFIGLECDIQNKHFRWQDGAPLTYVNEHLSNKCSGTERKLINPSTKHWEGLDFFFSAASFCQEADDIDKECGNFHPIDLGGISRCYFIHNKYNWNNDQEDAQLACQNQMSDLISIHSDAENTFVKRLALGNGWTEVYLGVEHASNTGFNWFDGSNSSYSNWAKGYPDSRVGTCVKMDVATGQWASTRCTDKLQFICGRAIKELLPHFSADCPEMGTSYKEQDHIYSPGYPYAQGNMNCMYNIKVAMSKRALVEVIFLEVNKDKGYLKLTDNGHNIAALTGSNHAGETYMSESNTMTLQFSTEFNANVRGFHIIVKAI